MAQLKLTKLQLQIMDIFWKRDSGLSVRQVHDALPSSHFAYTTVQTLVGRLVLKGALRRTGKIGNSHIFKAFISRASMQHRALDKFIILFGGRTGPLMARLAESGRLTLEDLQNAERHLRSLPKKDSRVK